MRFLRRLERHRKETAD
jgi:hypothetical protein